VLTADAAVSLAARFQYMSAGRVRPVEAAKGSLYNASDEVPYFTASAVRSSSATTPPRHAELLSRLDKSTTSIHARRLPSNAHRGMQFA
jgi:hypothetical protein